MVPNHDGIGDAREIREVFDKNPRPFKPVAYYDEPLDAIRVITADCSFTEVQIASNNYLTLFERNHVEEGQARYVGFTIEGARRLCREHGLKSRGLVNVSGILAFLSLIEKDGRAKGAIREIALPILEDNHIDNVEFPAD
ncbi:MAG: hypothetical protein HY507_01380 [Candidatus Zambryskibacteria bacterium]|nr:hypothetical protein [Candidatus Zambryskibacteria bacterium]